MAQLQFHNPSTFTPPPRRNDPPVVEKFISAYKIWQDFLPAFPKTVKYSLGGRIDSVFIEIFENLFAASYEAKGRKLPCLQKALTKFDLLKFLLHIAWEAKALDTKRYAHLSKPLDEIGKMLGGWRKHLTSV